MSSPSIFFIGVTGYLGGSIFTHLLALDNAPSHVTCLIRDKSKAKGIEGLSTPKTKVTTVIGSFDSDDVLIDQASKHDIILETASSDHLSSVESLIKGMKRGGRKPLFIHTSGTGTLIDDAKGMHKGEKRYSDLRQPPKGFLPLQSLPDDAFHRPIDLACVAADKEGICETYIILPGTIWDKGKGEIFDKGLANPYSQQIPAIIRGSLDRGQTGVVGEGKNDWAHVQIDDTAQLYALLYTKLTSSSQAERDEFGHGEDGYFFAVEGMYNLHEAAESIESALVSHGWAKPGITPFTEAELEKYFPGDLAPHDYMGTNSIAEAHKSRQKLGWKAERSSLRAFYKDCEHEAVRLGKDKK